MKKSARFVRLNISPEVIAALSNSPKKLYDWINRSDPQWYWLTYVRGGKLYVERWQTNGDNVHQDNNPFWQNDFHPDCSWVYDAEPGELRVFENRKTHFYSDVVASFLKTTGATKVYSHVPKEYAWLKINNRGGANVVSAELYMIRKNSDNIEEILRESDAYGSYTQELPADIEVLVVNYHNSGRGTDSITVHCRSVVELDKHTKELTKLIKNLK